MTRQKKVMRLDAEFIRLSRALEKSRNAAIKAVAASRDAERALCALVLKMLPSKELSMAEKFVVQYQDADISDALRARATPSRTVKGLRSFRFADGSSVTEYGDGDAWRVAENESA